MNFTQKQMLEAIKLYQQHKLDGLRMIRLTDNQAKMAADKCSEIGFIGSNRASKTLTAATRFASIVRDIPIITTSNQKVHCRLPHQRNRPLLTWVIGDHLRHIGQTIYRVLFQPGLFQMVIDKDTGFWRAWNPVMFPDDWKIPRSERRPGPPLIPGFDANHNIDPTSDIVDDAWYHANLNQFERIQLRDGTQIFAYANSSEVKQGDPVDEIWQDENMVYPEYYNEYVMRIVDNAGRMTWSTIPRDYCPAYTSLTERAEAQQREVDEGERLPDDVDTKVFHLSLAENPFIEEKEKQKAGARITNEREYMIRILGKSSENLIAVYPEFDARFHTVEYEGMVAHLNDKVTEALKNNNWYPPKDWTREIILDPGTEKPGVLFGTVPPPEFWDHAEPYLIVYNEIYIRRLDARGIAKKIRELEHTPKFNRMIIDNMMARQKPSGFSKTVGQQYIDEWTAEGIGTFENGCTFLPGDPNFLQRSTKVRRALLPRPCGRPQFRIITHKCPHLVRQMTRNRRKVDKEGNPLDVPADHQPDDLRVCVEYWISRHPKWEAPPDDPIDYTDPGIIKFNMIMAEWQKEQEARGSQRDNSVNIGAVI